VLAFDGPGVLSLVSRVCGAAFGGVRGALPEALVLFSLHFFVGFLICCDDCFL
jgi:hypothetical protein